MIGVLLLVLPAFLQSNSKLKQLLTNFTIWIIIVLIIVTFIYGAFFTSVICSDPNFGTLSWIDIPHDGLASHDRYHIDCNDAKLEIVKGADHSFSSEKCLKLIVNNLEELLELE